MKTSLTRCILLLLGFGLVSGLTAQTVYWGDQPGQGDFDGGLNGWTSEVVAGPDTSWTWVADGLVDGGTLAGQGETINSPTADNGAMVFNADAYTIGTGPIPDPPYAQYVVDLISPTIDLSAVPAGTGLSIEFYQLFLWFQVADDFDFFSSYSVSTDDGVTWTPAADANPNRPPSNAGNSTPPLNNSTTVRIPFDSGAAGSSTVKIKFTIAGNFYYWALDDIKIIERPNQFDLTVAPGWYATSPNYMIPLDQVEPIVFMTDVENVGGAVTEGVELGVTIEDDSGAQVYDESESYGTMTPDSLDENRVWGSFTPATQGEHTVTYAVTSNEADDDLTNNEVSYEFEVTERTFAKEDGPDRAIYSNDTNWDDGVPRSWTYGNHFYIVNGTDAGNLANTASFIIDNADDAEDIPIYIKLWKWDAPVDDWMDNPGAGDYTCPPEDREIVGRATYVVTGDEDDDEFVTVDLIDELSLEAGVTLDDNTHYILMAEFIDTGNDDSNVIGLGASEARDYAPSNFAAIEAGAPRFGAMIGLNGSGALADAIYNRVGFGQEIVPTIRMDVGPKIINTVEVLNDASVSIFPSPADKDLTVEITLGKEHANATVKVVSTLGTVVSEKAYSSLQNEVITFNSSEWASGSYFLQVSTPEGVKTKSFIVQH